MASGRLVRSTEKSRDIAATTTTAKGDIGVEEKKEETKALDRHVHTRHQLKEYLGSCQLAYCVDHQLSDLTLLQQRRF